MGSGLYQKRLFSIFQCQRAYLSGIWFMSTEIIVYFSMSKSLPYRDLVYVKRDYCTFLNVKKLTLAGSGFKHLKSLLLYNRRGVLNISNN